MRTPENRVLTDRVIAFLEQLGVDVTFKRFTTDNVQIKCPFAKVSGHSDSNDRNPSLGLKVTKEKGFVWHCFACGRKGRSFISFIQEMQAARLIDKAGDAYQIQNMVQVKFPAWNEAPVVLNDPKGVQITLEGLKPAWLSRMATEYHEERFIFRDAVEKCNLHFDRGHMQVVFPVYGKDGKLCGTTRHYINGKKPKYANPDFYSGDYVYLSWLAEKKTTGIVVEGMYDALRVYQHLRRGKMLNAYSVVSTFGSEVSPKQMKQLSEMFSSLILMGDNDDAGIKMENNIYKILHKRVPLIFRARYDAHDPGELSYSKFISALENRQLFGVR